MSPPIDPNIQACLMLNPFTAKVVSTNGSNWGSTSHIISPIAPTSVFLKTCSAPGAATMLEGEWESLVAISEIVPSFCPQLLGCGKLANTNNGHFIATEFVELGAHSTRAAGSSSSSSNGISKGSGLSLAQKLAKLHTTPAPIPEGHRTRQFGFPVTTCCGDTPQPNSYFTSWADFYANNRLLFIIRRGESLKGPDPELRKLVERTAETVVPRLLRPGHLGGESGITPVVVHGDLWSGNHGEAVITRPSSQTPKEADNDTITTVEDLIYDPSAAYAHSEYELGIMRMFGGFSSSFWHDYHALVPKTEPADEYEDRMMLYEVYHHLNHWAIFGGGYRASAMKLLKRLLRDS